MEIYNLTTEEIITLTIADTTTGTNMAADIVGGSFNDLEYNAVFARWEASGTVCAWWQSYCETYDAANSALHEWRQSATMEELEAYHNFIGGVEFNEIPTAIVSYITE